jgi:hypothetical protein
MENLHTKITSRGKKRQREQIEITEEAGYNGHFKEVRNYKNASEKSENAL